MLVDSKTWRESALMAWFGLTEDRETHNRIANELWCLRNNVDTTALADITLSEMSTSEIVNAVMSYPQEEPGYNAALLLCTLRELSEIMEAPTT